MNSSRQLFYSIWLITVSVLLSSCTDYGKMKTFLQTEYDNINPKGNMAICYYVGDDVTYPYINQPITAYSKQISNDYLTEALNERLPAFVKVGLLQEIEPGIGQDGKSYSQYTLTELGEKYAWSYQRSGHSKVYNENHFCFGRIVIDEVTKVEDHKSTLFVAETTETAFHFNYHVENVPDWAKDPALAMYGSKNYSIPNTIYRKQAWLTKKDGRYYNYGSTAGIIKEIVK